jgi:hypothetical protein
MSYHSASNTYYHNTTYLLPGEYHLTLWANDTSGNDITVPYTLDVNLLHPYPLYEGWNVITVPVDGDYTAESLGKNISGCTVIIGFNGSDQTFTSHVVGTPHDNFPLTVGNGYFIYMSKNTTCTVEGIMVDTISLPLYTGWNLIGWYQGTTTDANTLGQVIPGTTVITMFDAESQQFISHVITKGEPWDNFIIERGMGLFLYTTQDSTWDGYA